MNPTRANPQIASPQRFCVLAYTDPLDAALPLRDPVPIVLFLCPENAAARMMLNPAWKSVIPESAWRYFEDLLADCKERLAEDPGDLIDQLCSLSAGPFIATCTPADENTDSVLCALAAAFHDY